MNTKIVIKDPKGLLMKLLICAIIWYRDFMQKYFSISNAFLVLGVLLTVVVVLDALSRNRKNESIKLFRETYIIFLYVAMTYIAGFIVAPDMQNQLSNGFTIVEFSLVFLYVCYYTKTRGDIQFLVWNYVILYTLMCGLFIVSPVLYYEDKVARYSFSTTMNPNSFAMTLTIGTWAILYMISKKKIPILLGLPICGLMLYGVIMTASKKNLISIVLCLLLWIILVYLPLDKSKNIIKDIIKLTLFAFIIYIGVRLLLPLFSSSVMRLRFENLFSDQSTLERVSMYQNGWEYLKESPVLGYGFWGFQYFYGYYSHSTWVEVFVSSGIPLGLLYFSSYILIGYGLIRNIRLSKGRIEQNVEMRMFLILFILMAVYTFTIIHIYTLNSFIIFGAIIASFHLAEEKRAGFLQNEMTESISQ